MDKMDFLEQLRTGLAEMPQQDVAERINFYSEMIDDYTEEGLSEAEAVARIGSADEIAAQILADYVPSKTTAAKSRPSNWKIVAIILGSPIWLSLLISAFSVVFSLYISLWAVIISLWSIFGALCACAFGGILSGIGLAVSGYAVSGVALIGAASVCAGLSVFTYFGSKAVTKGGILLTKKLVLAVKNRLKKEDAEHA